MMQRSEAEMMHLLIQTAWQDERIRAVAMNGSRLNDRAPRDEFQDYDVVYAVTEIESFLREPDWIDVFGKRLIMQIPERMTLFPSEPSGRFAYLMLFRDGSRMDLTLVPMADFYSCLEKDSLTKVLLHKDGTAPGIPASSDRDHWVKKPSAALFSDCCNEFWWITTYVAKGLARKEILYAQDYLTSYARPMLRKMLEWQAGIRTGFSASIGKSGKYIHKHLAESEWLLSTYARAEDTDTWRALFAMCGLFRKTALETARYFGWVYPMEEDRCVTGYLEQVSSRFSGGQA